jgi:UDP-glucose 4-epimerase
MINRAEGSMTRTPLRENVGGNITVSRLEKVIVFGASGFIGSHICKYLERIPGLDVAGYSSVDCNLLDRYRVAEVLTFCSSEVSVVICSAISRLVEDSWEAMLKNITMTHNFASSIPDSGLRSIIFLSSTDVYGMPPVSLPINEETMPRPNRYYALSKLISEAILQFKPTCTCPVTILRLPGIYGAGDGAKSILSKFVKKLLQHEEIEISGDGTTRRDYVEVGDLCQVIDHFLQKPFPGLVNIAIGKSTAIKDIIALIAAVVGITPSIRFSPGTDDRSHDLVFDTSRLKSLCPDLKFKDLEQGIKEYVSHLLDDNLPPGV